MSEERDFPSAPAVPDVLPVKLLYPSESLDAGPPGRGISHQRNHSFKMV